jgi:hypothetical protein
VHQNFDSLQRSLTNLRNENAQFKVALRGYLNAQSFYSVGEFFMCTDDVWYLTTRLYKMFIIFCSVKFCMLCIFCMFMVYSTSYCLVTNLWIHGMYVCMLLMWQDTARGGGGEKG